MIAAAVCAPRSTAVADPPAIAPMSTPLINTSPAMVPLVVVAAIPAAVVELAVAVTPVEAVAALIAAALAIPLAELFANETPSAVEAPTL